MTLLVALLLQGIEDIGRRWSSEDPSERSAATAELFRDWIRWTEADLQKLEAWAKDVDGERAARAGEALGGLRRRRAFGEKLWPRIEAADDALARIRAGHGRVGILGYAIPGGPMIAPTAEVQALVGLGREVEPYLRPLLRDPAVRNEVAVALTDLIEIETIPALIDALPTKAKLDEADDLSYTLVVNALWRFTGQDIGIDGRMTQGYAPDVAARWRRWFDSRKAQLYRDGGQAALDVEAWAAGVPTAEYRRARPWPKVDDLREYCVSLLFRRSVRYGSFDHDAIVALSELRDPRVLPALRKLRREGNPPWWLGWAFKEQGAIEDLEELMRVDEEHARYPLALAKLGPVGRRVESSHALLVLRAREHAKGVDALLAALAKPDESLIEAAGRVDDERVRVALRKIVGDVDVQRALLASERSHVRLGAAEELWRRGHRDGFNVLLTLLELRPLDDGRGGSDVRCYVEPARTSSLGIVRRACELLGEMGDPQAIVPLRKLESENLNGFLGGGGTGTGWYGRPDLVARAKLGDDPPLERILSIEGYEGDRARPGDLLEIGLKRYARALIPLLSGSDERALYAARSIVKLLDEGK